MKTEARTKSEARLTQDQTGPRIREGLAALGYAAGFYHCIARPPIPSAADTRKSIAPTCRGLSEKRWNQAIQALTAPIVTLAGSALRRGLYRIIEYGPRKRKQSLVATRKKGDVCPEVSRETIQMA